MREDVEPFKLAGNLYFVGDYGFSSYLLVTREGLILIDTGYAKAADIIIKSMETLGFNISDVKYIVHSHCDKNRTGGTKKLAGLSGAKTFLAKTDSKYIHDFEPYFYIRDTDIIRLGDAEIECVSTPGHAEGALSFFFDVKENSNAYRVGMFGGGDVNRLKKENLKEQNLSYLLRGDYFKSIEKLRKRHVDILIENQPWHDKTMKNYKKDIVLSKNSLIDDTRWVKFLNKCEKNLEKIIEDESRKLFVNYAHRGASEYCPENTFLSFYTGVFLGANGIETDVRLTKDGVLVLFHDDTLTRATGEPGKISDYTFKELQRFTVIKNNFKDKIVKLEDFLTYFSFRNINFAIELKQENIEKEVVNLIRKHDLRDRVIITSFNFETLRNVREYAPELKTGYLTSGITEETLKKMKKYGIDEICPKGGEITKERVRYWHKKGFNVRAWGISDESIMKNAYDSFADGMTVNFPDKLNAYIDSLKT